MRDDELRGLLRERNPWWRSELTGSDPTAWVASDPVLRKASLRKIAYYPTLLDDVSYNGGLWILRGPRRVGKSVLLKRIARRLCDEGYAERLVFLSVDGFRPHDLRRAFALGKALTPSAKDLPRMWLIDEITDVEGWEKIVKELRDNTSLADDSLILTGSSASGFESAVRALGAGRTNVISPFRLLLPMTFGETLTAAGSSIPVPSPVLPDQLQSPSVRELVANYTPFVDELDMAWQKYLESGGFPTAVADVKEHGDVSSEFVTDLYSWLSTDVSSGEPIESVTMLLQAIHECATSPLDAKKMAEHLGLTRDVLIRRLEKMVHSFGAFWCHRSDDFGRRIPGTQAKLYLIDPLLGRLPSLLDSTSRYPDFTRLTENTLLLAMARSVSALHAERFLEQRAVSYTRTSNGKEIDCAPMPVSYGGEKSFTVPLESKWVSNNWRSEALVMKAKYQRGIAATKNIIDVSEDTWAIPAPLLALLLQPVAQIPGT